MFTNLPDLRDLQGLKGETKGPLKGDSKQLAMWAPGLVDAIALALRKWPQYKVYRVTQADWERHVANNHIPYLLIPSRHFGKMWSGLRGLIQSSMRCLIEFHN